MPKRIVEDCEVVTESSPGSRLAAVYAAQGADVLIELREGLQISVSNRKLRFQLLPGPMR